MVLAFAALLVLAACSSDSTSSGTTTTATTSSSSSSSAGSITTSSSSATAAGDDLDVATNAKLGQLLVDGKGLTVYLYEPDGTSATSTVPAGIAGNWPPVTVSGTPKLGAGLDASKAGGTTQLSYNGHLLYTFINDTKAGDANGQGLGSVWFAVSPSGEKVPT